MSATRANLGGRYRLGELLGQGGMGRVWAAHDEVLDRSVAVKEVLLPQGLADVDRDVLLARTLREARAAARVPHPHVVHVHDVVEDGGRPWVVLQLLEPRTLADVIAEEGPVAPERAARIGLELLEGLAAVHAAGVVHRDVKPANVLFDADGGAVLADFGIASLDGDPAVTTTGLLLGSPAYLAPERARGGPPSPAADLWSLGATLHAAVEGRAPFHRDGALPTLGALLTEDVPAAPSAGALAPALAALLVKDPATRADATRARALLEAALRAPATGAVPAAVGLSADSLSVDTQAMAFPADFPGRGDEADAPSVPAVPAVPAVLLSAPDVPAASALLPVSAASAASSVPAPRRRVAALIAAGVVAAAALPLAALGLRTAPEAPQPAASVAAVLPQPVARPKAVVVTRPTVKTPSAASRPAAKATTSPASGSAATGTRPSANEDRAATKDHPGRTKAEDRRTHRSSKKTKPGRDGKNHWIGRETSTPVFVTLPRHARSLPRVPRG